MTTEQFYQIKSCASIIQDLADKGAEYSNAVRVTKENFEFEQSNGRSDNAIDFHIESEKFKELKAKIEERIKAKNEELQKLMQ